MKQPIYDFSMRYAVEHGMATPRYMDILFKVVAQMQQHSIIITSAINTRACCAFSILLCVEDPDVTAKTIEAVTSCKKSTLAEAFK